MTTETAPLKRILVVEDEAVIVRLLERLFSRAQFGVTHCIVGSVRDGIDRIDNGSFDLLLSDLTLPDGRGLEVVRRFREKFPGKPIVIMSGSLTLEDDVAGETVSACLPKPFTLDTFHSVISGALAAH